MATSKPISTISYNTLEFLIPRLDKLVCSGRISSWFIMPHNGERVEDEACGKDHLHLLILPNKCVDLMQITNHFIEFDASNPKKPLKCMPFRVSKISDWILYALHEEDYLFAKGMVKHFHYTFDEFLTNDVDYLSLLYVEAKQTLKTNPVLRLKRSAESGLSFGDLVRSGAVSVQQIRNCELYYQYLGGRPDIETPQGLIFDDGLLVLPSGSMKRIFPDAPDGPAPEQMELNGVL